MDLPGVVILLGGAWALSVPFVMWLLLRARNWVAAAIYMLPAIWFIVGFALTLAGL